MVRHKILEFETKGKKTEYIEIRDEVAAFVKESGVKNGIVNIQSAHTTCAVIFEEMVHDRDIKGDEFLQVDLNHGLARVFPKEESDNYGYRYPGPVHLEFADHMDPGVREDMSCMLNAHAHLRASLLGASETFAVIDGAVQTGQWGYIYFVDFDDLRPRSRKCILTVIGE